MLAASPARAASPTPVPAAPPGWTLTFDDEFNGKTLDMEKWTPTDWASDINNELEYYVPDEVWVQDGYLRLQTRKRSHGGREYTSGEVRSVGKFSQLYGRFEFRARLPLTYGTWSAEYLIAENDHWPPEIDVEEYLGKDPHVLHMTAHWLNALGRHVSFHSPRDDMTTDYTQWHVYAIEWEPKLIRWYIDGTLYGETGKRARISFVPMYMRINTALGGWASEPTDESKWPQFHDVDYVRVYRRTSWPPPVNAGSDQEITLKATPGNEVKLHGLSCNPMGTHSAMWSQVGGIKPAVFTSPHSLATKAIFTAPGTYTLRLTVSSGTASGYDDLTVIVNSAPETNLLPTGDAYTFINSERPGLHVNGLSQDLNIGTRGSVEESRDVLQTYLTFDLSHAPKSVHAHLRLYGGEVYLGTAETLACEVRGVLAPAWDEKQGNWDAAPSLSPPITTFTVKPFVHHSTERWYDIDVSDYVKTRQQEGQSQIGFSLAAVDTGTSLSASFRSREDAAHAPHLIISPR